MNSTLLLSKFYHDLFSYPDVNLVRNCLNDSQGPLLDLGSASGRVMEQALDLGCKVYGIEDDKNMIDAGRIRLSKTQYASSDIKFIQGNFISIDYPDNIGTVTCIANTFTMILDRNKRMNVLSKAYNCLHENGNMLIAIKNDISETVTQRTVQVNTLHGEVVMNLNWFENLQDATRTYEISILWNNIRENHKFVTKLISENDMRNDISESGFQITKAYGDFDLSDLIRDSSWQIYSLRKRC